MSVVFRRLSSLVLLAGVAAGTAAGVRGDGGVAIAVEGRANANASIAARGAFVAVAWSARTPDGVTDIYSAASRDGGRTFAAPVRVNQVAGEASASGEQPPRIVVTARGAAAPEIAVVWTARSASGTRLLAARSVDGGKSFAAAVPVPGSAAGGNRGWESAAVTANGDVVAAWLDHRDVPARAPGAPAAGAHQHAGAAPGNPADGVARAQLSQVFFARLGDASSVKAIAPGVCYCCKTSLAAGADGSIVAAWRHVYPGNIRDIAVARSTDGGRTFAAPVRVSDDHWVLDGCPENGPAVAIDRTGAIHVAWPTLVRSAAGEESMALFYARSTDGRRFSARQPLPTEGTPRHPQIVATASGTIAVAWDEQAKGVRRAVLGVGAGADTGGVGFVRQPLDGDAATYPVIAASADALVVVSINGPAESSVLRVERRPMTR